RSLAAPVPRAAVRRHARRATRRSASAVAREGTAWERRACGNIPWLEPASGTVHARVRRVALLYNPPLTTLPRLDVTPRNPERDSPLRRFHGGRSREPVYRS